MVFWSLHMCDVNCTCRCLSIAWQHFWSSYLWSKIVSWESFNRFFVDYHLKPLRNLSAAVSNLRISVLFVSLLALHYNISHNSSSTYRTKHESSFSFHYRIFCSFHEHKNIQKIHKELITDCSFNLQLNSSTVRTPLKGPTRTN